MTLEPDPAPPSSGRRANRRQEIIQTAFEIFAERGFRGASLEQVAQRAGLTKAGLLHYFPSKDALLVAVLAERDRDSAAVGARGQQRQDAADGVRARWAGLHEVVARNTEQPGLVQAFTVLSAESVTDDHPAQEFFRQRYRVGRQTIADFLTTSRRDVSDEESLRAAALVLAVMDGLQLQWLLDPQEVDMVAAFDLFTTLLDHLGDQDSGRPG